MAIAICGAKPKGRGIIRYKEPMMISKIKLSTTSFDIFILTII
jgi:hypothetical protein